jgi:DNA primase
MRFSADFIEKVIQAADILSVVSDRGIQLKRIGANYRALCPFHTEKNPLIQRQSATRLLLLFWLRQRRQFNPICQGL